MLHTNPYKCWVPDWIHHGSVTHKHNLDPQLPQPIYVLQVQENCICDQWTIHDVKRCKFVQLGRMPQTYHQFHPKSESEGGAKYWKSQTKAKSAADTLELSSPSFFNHLKVLIEESPNGKDLPANDSLVRQVILAIKL